MYRTHVLAVALLVTANLAARELRPPRSTAPPPVAPPPVAPPPVAPPTVAPPATRLVPITDVAAGGTCNADFLREIRRHPHWTLRIDAYERRGCGLTPIVRDAYLLITPDGARWQRDRRERYDDDPWTGDPMPQHLDLTAADRARVLSAIDHVCAAQEPAGRWRIAVAIDPAAEPVMAVRSAALEDLMVELHERYVAARIAFAHGLSAHLTYRTVDDHDRIKTEHIDIARAGDLDDDDRVDVLDCLASLPEGENPVLHGTVVARGHKIWIAVPRAAAERASCLRSTLRWRANDRVVATPSQWPPPSDDYTARDDAGFAELVGLTDDAQARPR